MTKRRTRLAGSAEPASAANGPVRLTPVEPSQHIPIKITPLKPVLTRFVPQTSLADALNSLLSVDNAGIVSPRRVQDGAFCTWLMMNAPRSTNFRPGTTKFLDFLRTSGAALDKPQK